MGTSLGKKTGCLKGDREDGDVTEGAESVVGISPAVAYLAVCSVAAGDVIHSMQISRSAPPSVLPLPTAAGLLDNLFNGDPYFFLENDGKCRSLVNGELVLCWSPEEGLFRIVAGGRCDVSVNVVQAVQASNMTVPSPGCTLMVLASTPRLLVICCTRSSAMVAVDPQFFFIDTLTAECKRVMKLRLMVNDCLISPDESQVVFIDTKFIYVASVTQPFWEKQWPMEAFSSPRRVTLSRPHRAHGHRYIVCKTSEVHVSVLDLERGENAARSSNLQGIIDIDSSPGGESIVVLQSEFNPSPIILRQEGTDLVVCMTIDSSPLISPGSPVLGPCGSIVFSECGKMLALGAKLRRREETRIVFWKLPVSVLPLKALCRKTLLFCYKKEVLQDMPLPLALTKFLPLDYRTE